jgi:aminocarboxymuconate-semialdehyde decarboxylase
VYSSNTNEPAVSTTGPFFDMHIHYVPRSVVTELKGLDRLGIRYDDKEGRFIREGERQQSLPSELLELQPPFATRDAPVIQVLSPWSDLIRDDLSNAEGVALCRLMNDAMAADVSGNAQYLAMAALPIGEPASAASELERALSLGFVGGMIPTQVRGMNLDEWGVDPLLEASESLGAPIFIHPARVLGEDRLRKYFLRNLCGYPMETTIAAFALFFSGAMERFPESKVLLAHAGGLLTFLAGRAAHATSAVNELWSNRIHTDQILEVFYYDGVVHDPAALALALNKVGPERVVLGTDGPFSMGITDPIAHIMEAARLAGLTPEDVVNVVGRDTPRRLLSGLR